MAQYIGLQSHISSNYWRTVLLILAFPTLVGLVIRGVCRGILTYEGTNSNDLVMKLFGEVSIVVFPIMGILALVGFFFHRQLIFSRSGARIWADTDGRHVPIVLESLCISRGLPMPQLGIMDDNAMNAFALGRDPKQSRIVLSSGLVKNLTTHELEAVIAHELTHIINKDVLTMTILTVFVGAVSWIGSMLLRGVYFGSSSDDDKQDARIRLVMIGLGIGFTIISAIFLPLLLLAVSRKREYLADAGAVELTKNADAMIGALTAISSNPGVDTLHNNDSIAAMCIASPLSSSGFAGRWHELWSTHPSIESRIEALRRI